jgi:hypothetical protein
MKLSEEMDIKSDLTPENESQYAKNLILDKWIRIFGDQFINAADEITSEVVVPAGVVQTVALTKRIWN